MARKKPKRVKLVFKPGKTKVKPVEQFVVYEDETSEILRSEQDSDGTTEEIDFSEEAVLKRVYKTYD